MDILGQGKQPPTQEQQILHPELNMQNEAQAQQQQLVLAVRLEQLKKWYPQWFTYSDSIGERPIDGMMREISRRQYMMDQSKQQYNERAGSITRNVEQNWQVAPEYTEEQQMHVPPGMVQPMGRVM